MRQNPVDGIACQTGRIKIRFLVKTDAGSVRADTAVVFGAQQNISAGRRRFVFQIQAERISNKQFPLFFVKRGVNNLMNTLVCRISQPFRLSQIRCRIKRGKPVILRTVRMNCPIFAMSVIKKEFLVAIHQRGIGRGFADDKRRLGNIKTFGYKMSDFVSGLHGQIKTPYRRSTLFADFLLKNLNIRTFAFNIFALTLVQSPLSGFSEQSVDKIVDFRHFCPPTAISATRRVGVP